MKNLKAMRIRINKGVISVPTIMSYVIRNTKSHFNIRNVENGILVTLDDGSEEEHEIDADATVLLKLKELINGKGQSDKDIANGRP